MQIALQFDYAMLALTREGGGQMVIIASHNEHLESMNLRLPKAKLAGCCAGDVGR